MEPVTRIDQRGSWQRPGSPAQWYAALGGSLLVALAVLALVIEPVRFGVVGPIASQPELMLWSVSGWTAVFWMAMGALGILSVPRLETAREFAAVAGIIFVGAAIWGFLDGNDVARILVADTTDNITHAVLGGLGLLAAAVSRLPRDDQETQQPAAQRRSRTPLGHH